MDKKSPKEEIHLLDYLLVLARGSRMILLWTLGAMVLTYLFLLLLVPKEYTATARLMPPQQSLTLTGQLLEGLGVSSMPGAGAGALGGMAAGILGLKSPSEIYVGMLNGHTIFDRIIQQFNLKELYNTRYIEDTRKKLLGNATIQAGEDGLIIIEVTDKDQKRAADMANAFGEELDKLLKEIALRDAQNQFAFLEQERQQTLANLTKAEEELRQFSERTGVIQLDAQTQGLLSYVSTLRAEIDAREVQIQVLRKQATPFNFDVVRLETEVSGLKEKLREAERQADRTGLEEMRLPTSKVPGLGVEYIRLLRQVKYQDTLYQVFCKLAEMARLDGARNVSVATVQFVDRALPPEKKSKPQRAIITLIVGFVTFILLIVAAFVREFWARSLESEDNAAKLSHIHTYMSPWTTPFQKLKKKLKRK